MTWQTPSFVEIDMNPEVGAYTSADDPKPRLCEGDDTPERTAANADTRDA